MERIKTKLWRRHQNPDEAIRVNNDEMDTLQLATDENSRLQETVVDLTSQLQALKESHLALQSKNDDIEQRLQLERRRLEWQKTFYEKKIVEMALGLSNPNGGSVDPQAIINSLSDSFYHETIFELVTEQENKEGKIKELENTFKEEIRKLKEQHDSAVAEIVESNLFQVQHLTQTHEELIKDLLCGCEEGLFKEMKEEYLCDAANNSELTTTNGNKIWVQFTNLSLEKKGIIVACVCIVTVATAGWASWGFITWGWPRLVLFAEYVVSNPQVLRTWATFLMQFLNSLEFQGFVVAWEQGQPLALCLKPFLNTAILVSALQMGPDLIAKLKNRRSRRNMLPME